MSEIPNPISFLAEAGNIVFKCDYCGDIFVFIDDGEEHQAHCPARQQSQDAQADTEQKP